MCVLVCVCMCAFAHVYECFLFFLHLKTNILNFFRAQQECKRKSVMHYACSKDCELVNNRCISNLLIIISHLLFPKEDGGIVIGSNFLFFTTEHIYKIPFHQLEKSQTSGGDLLEQ